MNTRITILVALLLALVCSAASAQEYYTLPEIREQAAQGWHETYTDKYGRTIEVDIDIDVFGADKAPVITADVPPFIKYDYNHNGPYDSVTNVARKGGKRTHPYRTYGDTVNLDEAYGAQYGNELTVREVYCFMEGLFAEHGHGYSADDFFLSAPASFDIVYSKNVTTGGIHVPALYSIEFWQQMNDLPILSNAETGFKKSGTRSYYPKLLYQMRSEDEYSFYIRPLQEKEKIAEDIPLCSLERVICSVEDKIKTGHIQKVVSLRFGYVVYSDPAIKNFRKSNQEDEEFYLVPSWVVQCIFSEDPKEFRQDDIEVLNVDNEQYGEHQVIVKRIINAQTGEMLDYFDKSKNGGGDGSYQGFIPWDKVK